MAEGPRTMTDLGTTKPMSQTLGAPRVQQELDPELSLATIISVLRQNLRMIAIFAIAAPILAAFVVLLTERTWTASAAFLPESRRGGGGGLSSLAMQYGVNLGARLVWRESGRDGFPQSKGRFAR